MSKRLTVEQVREMSGCLCFNVRRAARALTQHYDAALRPYELRVTQLPILVATSASDAVLMAPLAGKLGMDRTTLLRNVRPLVRRGLVEVGPSADSRRTEIRATDAGRALLARAYGPWRRAQIEALKFLEDPKWAGALRPLADGIRQARA
jgi:DNA-binding MarR family transcriptional regulator